GSHSYVAPEALVDDNKSNPYGEASDMWSVGGIAYAMAFSELPYYGEDALSVRKAILEQPLNLDIAEPMRSDAIKTIIKGLMRINPSVRTGLSSLIHTLDAILDHSPNRGGHGGVRGLHASDSLEDMQRLDPVIPVSDKREDSRHVVPIINRTIERSPSLSQRLWQHMREMKEMSILPRQNTVNLPISSVLGLFLNLSVITLMISCRETMEMSLPLSFTSVVMIWMSNGENRAYPRWVLLRKCLLFLTCAYYIIYALSDPNGDHMKGFLFFILSLLHTLNYAIIQMDHSAQGHYVDLRAVRPLVEMERLRNNSLTTFQRPLNLSVERKNTPSLRIVPSPPSAKSMGQSSSMALSPSPSSLPWNRKRKHETDAIILADTEHNRDGIRRRK
ncbi:hypothetical protein AAMO2058_001717700, partial [Amorphochlora amoebiformis]